MVQQLHTKTARRRLKPRHKPYFERIGRRVWLSYRRASTGVAGRWGVRRYARDKRYKERTFSDADDLVTANGTTVEDYDQARDHARTVAQDIDKGERVDLGPVSVDDAMGDYLDWYRDHRKSVDHAEYSYKAHIKPRLGRKTIASLTTRTIRRWHSDLAKADARIRGRDNTCPLDPDDPEQVRKRRATANRTLTVLKAGLNYAFREGAIDDDTAWRRVQPFRNVDAPRVRFLTIAESKRLINSAAPDLRRLVRAALLTGARYGELVALEVGDYDPDGGTVYIRDSKSGKPRHIPLTDEGQGFFEELTAGREIDETLFVRADGSPWGKSHQARPLREAAQHVRPGRRSERHPHAVPEEAGPVIHW